MQTNNKEITQKITKCKIKNKQDTIINQIFNNTIRTNRNDFNNINNILSTENNYIISIQKGIIIMYDGNKLVNEDFLLLLNKNNTKINPFNKTDLIVINEIFSSFIKRYEKLKTTFYTFNKIENSVVYVFLMPYLTSKNEYIFKVGYASNLLIRSNNLLKEHNIDNIYLLYVENVKNESYEHKLHSELKSKFSEYYYPVNKYEKKIETNNKCTETYIGSYLLLKFIVSILYNIKMTTELELLNAETKLEKEKQNTKNIESDNKLKIIDAEIKSTNIETDNKLKIMDAETQLEKQKQITNNIENKILENKIKLLKLELKMKK
jgi:hypothetical protein